jgi:hypothetical protein
MDKYDELMSDLLTEARDLLDAGLEDERTGTDFSTGEQFTMITRRIWELATARGDKKPTRRGAERSNFSERDRVFSRVSERRTADLALRAKKT